MSDKLKLIIVSVIPALFLLAVDRAANALLFRQDTFSEPFLFGVSIRELYSWSLIIAGLVIYGIIISKIVFKRNHALEAMRHSEEALRIITNAAKNAIVMMDNQGKISSWNPAAEKIFGYTTHETIGEKLHTLLVPQRHHQVFERCLNRFKETADGAAVGMTLELTAMRKDGMEFPAKMSLSAFQLQGKWHALGILSDITERKKSDEELRTHSELLDHRVEERTKEFKYVNDQLKDEILYRKRTEEELRRSESFLGTIFDSIHDPFSIVDRDYRIIKLNDAYARMRNKQTKDLLGNKCYEVLQNRNSICEECVVDKTFLSMDPCTKEKLKRYPDGSTAWYEICTYPIFDQNRNVSHVIEYTRDITDRKKTEEENKQLIRKLDYLSTTDSLTGVYNRRALNDILGHEIDRATRYNIDLSLILCDVDRLKKINDTYGHIAGDLALQSVSETLKRSLRKADILGRYGGDEFMIVLPETTFKGAKSLAEKIRSAVNNIDFELPDQKRIRLSISIGVASCCALSKNSDTLVARTDAALYTSKEAGRNRVSAVNV